MPSAFVVGNPIKHSMSPILHGYWLKKYGIDGNYEPVELDPDDLSAFMQKLARGYYSGGNVTIPFKEAVLNYCDHLDPAAQSIGAVNTLWTENGRIYGGNTDSHGFTANLDSSAPGWENLRRALVIGAGGAARAVLHGLIHRKFEEIKIVNRTQSRAKKLAQYFGNQISVAGLPEKLPPQYREALIVNASSLGMAGQKPLNLDLEGLGQDAIICDLVYNPLTTPLLEQAAQKGARTVDGLGMLIHQAVPAFERFFGHRPEIDLLLREKIVTKLMKKD